MAELFGEILFLCAYSSYIVEISFRYFNCYVLLVIMHFSSNCNKFLECAYSVFGFFVFPNMRAGFKISVLVSITVALQCTVVLVAPRSDCSNIKLW